MLVGEVMTREPVTVRPEDTLRAATARMQAANCRRLPVVDETGHVCGIITDRDLRLVANSPLVLRERWQDDMLLDHTAVGACMSPDPVCVAPDLPVEQAIDLLVLHRISGLPVVENGELVGVVTVTDLIRALATLLRAR
ncbi:CBS domain-containing protein [Aggregatilinea lenta]|uniref:CBS domain-containing protein n=1 Tax=Aggregatilinea lenta TaxID=913108 RepID=UPI000E5B5767|nr:CBS domain-containing protein [Aggregatilinea lenta]